MRIRTSKLESRRWLLPLLAVALLGWGGAAIMSVEGCKAERLGGCQTTSRDYGLAAVADSAVLDALGELLAPGTGSKVGPNCERLGVAVPLFAQIGASDSLPDEVWVAIAGELSERITAADIRIGERSPLRHTTGPCFPRYHVDFRGAGEADAVAAFLAALPQTEWRQFSPVARRSERQLFVTAGTSLQQMDTVVDLK